MKAPVLGPTSDHSDFTQELPRQLLPTGAKVAQSHLRETP